MGFCWPLTGTYFMCWWAGALTLPCSRQPVDRYHVPTARNRRCSRAWTPLQPPPPPPTHTHAPSCAPQTAMAQRTLRQWITQPLIDAAEIRRRQDLVEVFFDDALFCASIREDVLRHVPDLDAILKKMQRRRAKLEDAVALQRLLGYIPQLVAALKEYQGEHRELLSKELVEPLEEISGSWGRRPWGCPLGMGWFCSSVTTA